MRKFISILLCLCLIFVPLCVGVAAAGYPDFSENNMITNTSHYEPDSFSRTADSGGNDWLATAYLSSWDGPVLEESDPYSATGSADGIEYKELDAVYHVQDVLHLPPRADVYDNDLLKQTVMRYGAVSTSFLCDNDYFNLDFSSYYYSGSMNTNLGHAISIVGWDDEYSKYNFEVTPPDDGAFICQNSWGDYSGEDGYFYVSYYDPFFASYNTTASYCSAESTDNFDMIYQYDPCGAVATAAEAFEFSANVFPESGDALETDEILRAASFYTVNPNTQYSVYVVTDFYDKSSFENMTLVETGTFVYPGYHTVRLSNPVELDAGSRFAVVVTLRTQDGELDYSAVEIPLGYFSTYRNVKANSGEGYAYYDDGWHDLTRLISNANFCIKAFTDSAVSPLGNQLSSATRNAINNAARDYESDVVYTVNSARAAGLVLNEDCVDYIEENGAQLPDSAVNLPSTMPVFSGSSIDVDYSIPEYYNLRDSARVNGVEDQFDLGSCWAFSSLASMESWIRTCTEYTPAVNLRLDATEKALLIGDSFTLSCSMLDGLAVNEDVEWISSDPDVAEVENGCVTAKADGTVVIYAYVDGIAGYETCTVTCSDPIDVTGISSTVSSEFEMLTGKKYSAFYSVAPSNATNKEVTVVCDNPAVATFADGNLIAVAPGEANVTVTTVDGGYSVSIHVSVRNFVFYEHSMALNYKDAAAINVKLGYGKEISQWKSSDPSVVSVDANGNIKATGKGTATVTAVDADGCTDSCEITVSYTFFQYIIIYIFFGWLWY